MSEYLQLCELVCETGFCMQRSKVIDAARRISALGKTSLELQARVDELVETCQIVNKYTPRDIDLQ